MAMNKAFASETGRHHFVEFLSLITPSENKQYIWLARAAFQNMKHAFDLMLYES